MGNFLYLLVVTFFSHFPRFVVFPVFSFGIFIIGIVDANDSFFPVAFSVISSESEAAIFFIFSKFKQLVEQHIDHDFVIRYAVADAATAPRNAMRRIWPQVTMYEQ